MPATHVIIKLEGWGSYIFCSFYVVERGVCNSYNPSARDVSGLNHEARGREAPEG